VGLGLLLIILKLMSSRASTDFFPPCFWWISFMSPSSTDELFPWRPQISSVPSVLPRGPLPPFRSRPHCHLFVTHQVRKSLPFGPPSFCFQFRRLLIVSDPRCRRGFCLPPPCLACLEDTLSLGSFHYFGNCLQCELPVMPPLSFSLLPLFCFFV